MSSESIPTPQCSTKQYYATNSPWEEAIGYYRAVRHNKNIYISGTTAVDPFSTPSNPRVLHPGDAAAQTRVTIDEIVKAIKALGGRAPRTPTPWLRARRGDEPKFVDAVESIVAAARKHDKWVGRLSNDGMSARKHLEVFATVAMSYDIRAMQNCYKAKLQIAQS
ncbi:hypothetical protein D6D00_09214 [Aureobasidium pullulans]|nr:hypothetical protein D6D00_09214 [Aureobasidium pullulans]